MNTASAEWTIPRSWIPDQVRDDEHSSARGVARGPLRRRVASDGADEAGAALGPDRAAGAVGLGAAAEARHRQAVENALAGDVDRRAERRQSGEAEALQDQRPGPLDRVR